MARLAAAFLAACVFAIPGIAEAAQAAPHPAIYFPDRFEWQHKKPEEVGMNAAKLDEAVKSPITSENPLANAMIEYRATSFGAREPMDTPIGPGRGRGPRAGFIARHGTLVAQWGDPSHVDMTFSIRKTFLRTVFALAWQKGLIDDSNDYARDDRPAGVDLFEALHNRALGWEHLLRQTSDAQGTLWGLWLEGNRNTTIDTDHDSDIVPLVRWSSTISALNDVVGQMLAAIEKPERQQ
jgi:hypothetical protein